MLPKYNHNKKQVSSRIHDLRSFENSSINLQNKLSSPPHSSVICVSVCVLQLFSTASLISIKFLSFKSTLNCFKTIAFRYFINYLTGILSRSGFLSFACQLISPCEKKDFRRTRAEKKVSKKKKSIQHSPLV